MVLSCEADTICLPSGVGSKGSEAQLLPARGTPSTPLLPVGSAPQPNWGAGFRSVPLLHFKNSVHREDLTQFSHRLIASVAELLRIGALIQQSKPGSAASLVPAGSSPGVRL
jgi:hypothetical protein